MRFQRMGVRCQKITGSVVDTHKGVRCGTVFSHIVQKRLSQESENIATEALAFILQSSEAAQGGMMKLLRGIVPDLPNLWFRTQQMQGNSRPDMWGLDETASAHVFVENKFWAGLTDSQPVSYLKELGERPHSSLLLVVVPAAREKAVWRELARRLAESGISADGAPCHARVRFCRQNRGRASHGPHHLDYAPCVLRRGNG